MSKMGKKPLTCKLSNNHLSGNLMYFEQTNATSRNPWLTNLFNGLHYAETKEQLSLFLFSSFFFFYKSCIFKDVCRILFCTLYHLAIRSLLSSCMPPQSASALCSMFVSIGTSGFCTKPRLDSSGGKQTLGQTGQSWREQQLVCSQ